jgi:hypothetical protein
VDPKRSPRAVPDPLRPQGSLLQPARAGVQPKRPGSPAEASLGPGQRQLPGLAEVFDRLDRDIKQLRVDFERFFNGALPFPPEELRTRVQGQLRSLRGMNLKSFADNFRLGDLEARFNSYNELFNRRLRDAEEGRRPISRPVPLPVSRFDPEKGIVFGDHIDPEAVEALYQRLAAAPGDAGPRFDLDSFQTYLTRQVAAIREKTGCSQVQFRLAADEDGKLKLKARPVVAREGA